jgi:hypothetical protein
MKTIFLVLASLAIQCLPANAARSRHSDIPGDGVINCGPNASFQPICPGGVGSVSLSSGALTGVLHQGGSTLGINLSSTAAVLTFAATPANPNNPSGYNSDWTGPLGLNPLFQPSASNVGTVGLPAQLPPSLAYFDATVPISGQEIRLNVTNSGGTTLNGVSFYLGKNVNSLSNAAQPQDDGLTFGLACSGQTHAEGTPNDCALAANWKMLVTPSGPGNLNPADLNSSSAAFGDALRFGQVDLAPGQTGQFAFFLTDYLSTRTPPGGVFAPANQSFVLEVAPTFQPVPEPQSAVLLGVGLLVISGAMAYFKRVNRTR